MTHKDAQTKTFSASAPQKITMRNAFLIAVLALALFSVLFGTAAALSVNGILTWDGAWTGNRFSCAPGYTVTQYHYDCGCSNNATWYVCVPSGTPAYSQGTYQSYYQSSYDGPGGKPGGNPLE